ncbi:MAG: copper homeostasis membrane protein CopD [Brevundimonas diminuta]|jgi:putative copper resistance protein D|uniref:copper homeostasis membrane protein CopD n=1 Tax=Brevundimonas diminuta TaxID=293 RepID=UPI000ECA4788|nr:copper homeostasis membrane protein CopD [Brevundimonas diminuta]MBI2250625.1 copper homeostasis membrane protein CopD [Brevundimonas diminuta]HCQ54363.1 copper resistance protein CopD [Brevundimonas diminuta]
MLEVSVVFLRLAQYLGAMLLLGVPLFFAFRMPTSDAAVERWPRKTLLIAAFATAIASLAALVLQTAVMAGSMAEALKPASLAYMAFDMEIGRAFLARAVVSALAGVLLLVLRPNRASWIGLAILGLVVCASLAWTGHGGATEGAPGVIHLGADVIHAAAAAMWLGALAALGLFLTIPHGDPERDRLTHDALHGFAGMGTLAVGLLVATGLVNTWFLVGPDRLGALLTTPYGLLLTAKLAVFVGMLALAASNRFVLTPCLHRALEDESQKSSAIRALRRSLVLETLLAIILLGLVAVMGTLAPPAAMMM